jgi:single-stranded-DNA-specific exonuclease
MASILARRGFETAASAEQFLAGGESHPPSAFDSMDAAVSEVLEARDAGRPITIYGDFDVDGVTSTSILVRSLRELGAECDWFIPDRISEGYGLNEEAITAIAARGTGLVITVDCGVTAVEEVALARRLGMGIVVTDHHRPAETLPDCTILHPTLSSYPFEHLCGAAVAWKLSCALKEAVSHTDPPAGGLSDPDSDLDLVALATVADMMPLEGENRRLVREGVAVARRAERPGMRALMAQSRVEPATLSAQDFGFRLGPRINAAGRMYRADAGVELFLATSPDRSEQISEELNRANSERRRIGAEVESAARAARRELDDSSPCSLVLAGEGWHAGVVGIVAARLSREFSRPTVVLSTDGEVARGSARSVPGLDLHDALSEVSGLLETFGGHAAAAGLTVRTEVIPEFRTAFERAVVARIGPKPKKLPVPVDAFAGGDELGLELAEELERLEPCGKGNPVPVLVIPGARICDVQEIGEGRHCRFTVVSGSARARGVSFGRTDFGVGEETRVDVLAELTVNHWNGSVEPQLKVLETFPYPEPDPEPLVDCDEDEWWRRFEVAFEGGAGGTSAPGGTDSPSSGRQQRLDCPVEVALGEVASSGEPLTVVTADARRRWSSLGGAAGISRLTGPEGSAPVAMWAGSPAGEMASFAEACSSSVGICDYTTLEVAGRALTPAGTVLLLDPPASPAQYAAATRSAATALAVGDPAALAFAEAAAGDRHALTPHLRGLYRDLREAGEGTDSGLRPLLAGDPDIPHSPEGSATLLTILVEAGAAWTEGAGRARRAGVVSSVKVELGSSPAFRRQEEIHKEQIAFLRQSNSP